MTVRAWFTISALILVALTVAIFVRLLSPAPVPTILIRAEETRLEGTLEQSCWPQRGEELRCRTGDDEPDTETIPASGEMRVVVAYPAQPDEGSIVIRRGGADGPEVLREDWTDELAYDLPAGSYVLVADARYPADAFVRYRFAFRVTS